MASGTIPNEREIIDLTTQAHAVVNAMNASGDPMGACMWYHHAYEEICPELISDLTDSGTKRRMKGEEKRQNTFRLIKALLDVHLDLYQAATERAAQVENPGQINDLVRLPALSILQAGFICLSFLEFSDHLSNIAELERLVRKGEINPASRDHYVREAIDLLKEDLGSRKRIIKARSAPRSEEAGRKTKARNG